MSIVRRYFDAQIDGIKKDTALRFYGAFLAVGQVLTFWAWHSTKAVNYLSDEAKPVCWPFFENCFRYRFFNYDEAKLILFLFGFISVIGVLLFLSKKLCGVAYWWLILVNLFKTLIYVQDYSLRLNQHYMLYFATFVFLFLPNKRRLLRYTVVLFYFWASTLKFDMEWISGKALYAKPLWIPDALIPASCVYVIILEAVITWGVLSDRKWVYWSTFFQLCLFHIISWPVVGFFYPLLMFALLAIFPLTYFIPDPAGTKSLLNSLFKGKEPPATYLFIGFFSLMQLIPVVMPGDERVTGEGRLFSLHMFDALVVCEGAITLKFKDGTKQELPIPFKEIGAPRIKCDPIVNFSRAKQLCTKFNDQPAFLDLDLYYEARRGHEEHMRPLVDIKDFCSQNLSYDLLRPNDWILKD